ncbi:MAG: hypothetical protein MK020_04700 [Dehalococcoidia bacterium]|mgnify:CR=1 FL=1|nr:hypothetical protein [Dehalococcoidia bacterium]
MWVKLMDVPDGYAASIWRELFNQEALSTRIIPPIETGLMYESRSIWVPDGKTHVAREIMNKI